MRKTRRRYSPIWRLFLTLMLVVSALGSPALTLAAESDYEPAARKLQALGIISGDAKGDLMLDSQVTRAQVAKILVAAFGLEPDAKAYTGELPFKDLAEHWAQGYVAVAKAKGWISGYPDGTFGAEKPVSGNEVVTLLMRALGYDSAAKEASGSWPDNYISAAMNVGLLNQKLQQALIRSNLPAEDVAALAPGETSSALKNALSKAALRKDVFSVADTGFSQVPVVEKAKTVYVMIEESAAAAGTTTGTGATGATGPAAGGTAAPKPAPPVLTVNEVPSLTSKTWVALTGTITPGATLLVNGEAKVTNPNGTFAMPANVTPGRNEIVVVARNEGGEDRKVLVVEQVPPAINAPAALTVAAGAEVALNVVAVDEGKEYAYGQTPDLQGGVIGEIGWLNAAQGSFLAADSPGATGKLVFIYKDARVEVPVTLGLPAIAKVEVSPAAISLKAGTPQKFTARALDGADRELAGQAVTWSTEAGKGVIDASGSFSAVGAGTIRVTATIGGVSGQATVTVAGPATKLAIGGPLPDLVANGAGLQDVTVTALDKDGNVAADFTGNITLSVSGAQYAGFLSAGAISASTTQVKAAVGGVATFTLLANKQAGSTELQASSPNLTGATGTIVTAPQVIAKIKVEASPNQLAADNISVSNLTVKLLDQEAQPFIGNDVTAWSAAFTSSNPSVVTTTGTITNATANTTTGATIVATANAKSQVGTANISVSVRQSGQEKFTGSVAISTILIGEPVKIAAVSTPSGTARQVGGSETMDLQVKLLDPNGNLVTRVNDFTGLALTLMADDNLYTAVMSPTSATTRVSGNISSNGVALTAANASVTGGVVTVRLASGKAQSINFTVAGTSRGSNLQTATFKGTFTPGSARTVTLAAVKGTVSPGGGSDTLRASLRDDADLNTSTMPLTQKNLATSATLTVTFRRLSGSATSWSGDQTATAQAGIAEVSVPVTATVGTDQFDARITVGTTVTSNAAPMRVAVMGAAYRVAFGTYPTAASPGRVGLSHTTTVLIKDSQATPETVTTDQGTTVTLVLKDSTGATVGTSTAKTAYGVATFEVPALTQSGTFTATASAGNLVTATVSDYVLSPGAATKLIGTLGASKISAASDSTTTLTIWAADAGGNKLTDTLSGVMVTSSKLTIAGLTGTCTGSSCAYTVTATSNPGATTLSATKSGLESFAIELTTVVTGEARDPEIIVDEGNRVGFPGGSEPPVAQRVRVVLKDANGNRVTQTGGQKWVRLVAEGTGYDGTNTRVYAGSPLTSSTVTPKHWVQSVQGEATFYVYTTLAGTITYSARMVAENESDFTVPSTTTRTATGTFAARTPYKVMVTIPTPSSIRGDGASIASVTAKVTDEYGNATTISGRFRLTLSSNTHVTLSGADLDNSLTIATTTGTVTTVLMARQVTSTGSATVTATFTPTNPTSLPGGTSGTSDPMTITY